MEKSRSAALTETLINFFHWLNGIVDGGAAWWFGPLIASLIMKVGKSGGETYREKESVVEWTVWQPETTEREATGHFRDDFSRFCTLLKAPCLLSPPLRHLSARHPVQKALFSSLFNRVLDSLHFVFCLPAAPSYSTGVSSPWMAGTVPCWQLFRVLKRAVKKF